ncbi:hypothetical protein AJ79_07956 [Helicocarpus griseus UAMH5409]|uniref:Peroxin/Ferlin domain-containing protein n=1 Tax=Helicocarpus griseus UAMH5409 TaxID=1447875 RepID=A0A2B7WXJ7_9EURO|nr:hypothetical protein AJ79_07956 [Helicocarpus griseus UAMH5409]
MSASSTISLVDNTSTTTTNEHPSQNGSRDLHLSTSSGTPPSLAKKLTKGSVKDSLARRKYAKYQEGRYSSGSGVDGGEGEGEGSPSRDPSLSQHASIETEPQLSKRPSSTEAGKRSIIQTIDVERAPSQSQPPPAPETIEIDVLYENQRGWWFFGVPLYSAESLLNLDPSAWLTRSLEVSPVDITNAQVPDPSWEWAWDRWYIDMSYDVDEAGWQYSLAFSSRFAWHGTHPWYHCFARRRRWLRKRVKKSEGIGGGSEEDIAAGGREHAVLNGNYFRVGSRQAVGGSHGSRGVTCGARSSAGADREVSPEDITDIGTLLSAIKAAALDRDKIVAIQHFVSNAGEELDYLSEKMPEILSIFMYQTSRRQLLDYIVETIESIPTDSEGGEKRKRENLVKVIEEGRLNGLQYWKDEKTLVKKEQHAIVDETEVPVVQSEKSKGKAVARSVEDTE